MKLYLDHIKQTFQYLHIMHTLCIQIWCMLDSRTFSDFHIEASKSLFALKRYIFYDTLVYKIPSGIFLLYIIFDTLHLAL